MIEVKQLEDIATEYSNSWEDISMTYTTKKGKEKTVSFPLILTGGNGVYVFMEEFYKEEAHLIQSALESKFKLHTGVFLFIDRDSAADYDDEVRAWFYNSNAKKFLKLSDLNGAFETFFYNHLIPYADLDMYDFSRLENYFKIQDDIDESEYKSSEDSDREKHKYIKPVVSNAGLEKVEAALNDLLEKGRKEGDYYYYPDGSVEVEKSISKSKYLVSFSQPTKYRFPCVEESGETSLKRMLLGGWLGTYKFKDKKIGAGIFYLLTCGGFVIFYAMDLISAIFGDYHISTKKYFFDKEVRAAAREEKRQYYRPVKNKKLFLGIPAAIVACVLSFYFIYAPAYMKVTGAFANSASQIVEKYYANKFQDELIEKLKDPNLTEEEKAMIEAQLNAADNDTDNTENPDISAPQK